MAASPHPSALALALASEERPKLWKTEREQAKAKQCHGMDGGMDGWMDGKVVLGIGITGTGTGTGIGIGIGIAATIRTRLIGAGSGIGIVGIAYNRIGIGTALVRYVDEC